MSRNFRHRPSAPLEPKRVLRKSHKGDSSDDDDDYAGVDLISDSEEDEPDVEVAEEKAIIESEEGEDDDATPRPYHEDDQSSWVGFEDEESQTVLADAPSFFEEHMAPTDPFAEASEWIANNSSDDDETFAEAARRVRFDLSDSESGETDVEDMFPQTFLDQNSLDPTFRRYIENDQDNDDGVPSDTSIWDFNGDEAELYEEPDEEDPDETSSFGSSGYETDDGETTDDNLPEEAKYLPTRKILRRQSTDSSSSDDEVPVRRNYYRAPRNGPRLGSWVTDATKPFALIASANKLLMFRAQISNGRSRLSDGGSRPTTAPGFIEGSDRETSGTEQLSPMLSNSTKLVGEAMSSLFAPMYPAESHYASGPLMSYDGRVLNFDTNGMSIGANDRGIATQNSSSFEDDTADEYEVLALGDLIHMGDSDDEDEEVDDACPIQTNGHATSPGRSSPSRTNGHSSALIRPTALTSEDQIHPLLNHLGRGVAGAFRQNQARHQLVSRNIASRESLDFSGPYHYGTLRGIKSDRLEAANAPITPSRRFKDFKAKAPDMQPSTPVVAGEKRKLSNGDTHPTHKRTRSAA